MFNTIVGGAASLAPVDLNKMTRAGSFSFAPETSFENAPSELSGKKAAGILHVIHVRNSRDQQNKIQILFSTVGVSATRLINQDEESFEECVLTSGGGSHGEVSLTNIKDIVGNGIDQSKISIECFKKGVISVFANTYTAVGNEVIDLVIPCEVNSTVNKQLVLNMFLSLKAGVTTTPNLDLQVYAVDSKNKVLKQYDVCLAKEFPVKDVGVLINVDVVNTILQEVPQGTNFLHIYLLNNTIDIDDNKLQIIDKLKVTVKGA